VPSGSVTEPGDETVPEEGTVAKWCLLIMAAAVLVAGCNDDDDCPQCPADNLGPAPTLANIWPHADGAQWVYDLTFNQYAPVNADPTPPMPSLAELHAALQAPVPTDLVESSTALYRLQFDGEVTTESGVTAQNLVGTYFTELGEVRVVDSRRSLLLAIARARPDRRDAILARLGLRADQAKSLADAREPFFLGAYAFAFEDSGYFGYGDLDDHHSWVYLAGDLEVGSEFSLLLAPELIDDVWLYGKIWSVGDRIVDGVIWHDVVECLYAVDLGIVQATGEDGDLLGTARNYYYGTTLFVPAVGPIACDERHVWISTDLLQEPWTSYEEYHCRLAGPGN
jgi:hypothetical protein